jgi:hypothetical protein
MVVILLKLTFIGDTQHVFTCVSTMMRNSNAQLTTDSTVAPPREEKFVNDPYCSVMWRRHHYGVELHDLGLTLGAQGL